MVKKRILPAALIICLAVVCFVAGSHINRNNLLDYIFDDSAPLVGAPEETVFTTQYATLDTTNKNKGYITVKYLLDINSGVKVQIQKTDGERYLYNITQKDAVETFPLTSGNGDYSIRIYRQVDGDKYAVVMSKEIKVELEDEFAPFINPSQYINYTNETKCVAEAAEITKDLETDIQKVEAVFNYVVNNFTYNYELAATVKSGYIPNLDNVFETKTGICFDYSATMAAMLRSQGIPCKMIFGYTGSVYHAWVNVYIKDIGWVDQFIRFDGQDWTLMDPTFVSSGNGSESIMKYVTTKTNYVEKYVY